MLSNVILPRRRVGAKTVADISSSDSVLSLCVGSCTAPNHAELDPDTLSVISVLVAANDAEMSLLFTRGSQWHIAEALKYLSTRVVYGMHPTVQ
jgi:hypothetical protein